MLGSANVVEGSLYGYDALQIESIDVMNTTIRDNTRQILALKDIDQLNMQHCHCCYNVIILIITAISKVENYHDNLFTVIDHFKAGLDRVWSKIKD